MPSTTLRNTDPMVELMYAALAAYGPTRVTINHTVLTYLDNGGDACKLCDATGRVINIQAYYRDRLTDEDVMLEGCTSCVTRAIANRADTEISVQIETQIPR